MFTDKECKHSTVIAVYTFMAVIAVSADVTATRLPWYGEMHIATGFNPMQCTK